MKTQKHLGSVAQTPFILVAESFIHYVFLMFCAVTANKISRPELRTTVSQTLNSPVVAAGVGPPPDPVLFSGHGQFVIPCRREYTTQSLNHSQDYELLAHGESVLVLSMPSVLGRGFVRGCRA